MSSNKTAEEKAREYANKEEAQEQGPYPFNYVYQAYLAGHAEGLKSNVEKHVESYEKVNSSFYDKLLDSVKIIADAEAKLASQETLIAELRSQLEEATEVIGFYAHVNNPKDLGSWDMRKNFVFDIIQGDDCDNAHYEITKYQFGGKRARNYLAKHFGEGKG